MSPQSRFAPVRLLALLGLIALILAPGWSAPVSASTILDVNSTLDVVDASPGDGVCETATGNGECTLRAALMEANHTPGGAATVNVPAGTYLLTIPNGAAPDEAQGDLDITANTEVIGAGAEGVFLDGDNNSAIGRVLEVASSATVTISDLTVRNGTPDGGITNEGTLTLTRVVSTGNHPHGIYNYKGKIVLVESTVSNNSGGAPAAGITAFEGSTYVLGSIIDGNEGIFGGGIFNHGVLTVENSIISNNLAVDGAGVYHDQGGTALIRGSAIVGNHSEAWGGGIMNNSGIVTITASVMGGNTAYAGGAIHNHPASTLTVTNSTIAGNHATFDGGGIQNDQGQSTELLNVTVTGNVADSDLDGDGLGGGIAHYAGYGPLIIQNSLIAGNYDSEFDGANWVPVVGDCAGALTSLGYNLMQAYSPDCTINGGGVTLADPLLGPLAYNGGPTQTHALLPGSPAIDGGNPAGCLDTDGLLLAADQRGVFRHAGGRCDIGAFEYHAYTYYLPILAR